MNVEYTGRKFEITPVIRKEVEVGLNKIRKLLGDRFETKVVLAVEKRRHRSSAQTGAEVQDEVAEQETQGREEI
jgi:ribosome-associated translation inhibitor RaiA